MPATVVFDSEIGQWAVFAGPVWLACFDDKADAESLAEAEEKAETAQRIRAASTRAELDAIALELQGLGALDADDIREADPTSADEARAILLASLED